MKILVQKFGGTTVSNSDRLRRVAKRIIRSVKDDQKVVAVVSAQGDTTDKLLALAYEIMDKPDPREIDMLLTTGEQVSSALLAMAIQAIGGRAISLTGEQAGIVTDDSFTNARIISLTGDRIRKELENHEVVVLAGFQGVTRAGDFTTLGRGGSDTTAVAVAAAIGAVECEIYKDVDGIYAADPRMVDNPRKLEKIHYDEMLEFAGAGARVVHPRAVEFDRRYNVPIHVRSIFTLNQGTYITGEENDMEESYIRGVTYDRKISKVTLVNVEDVPGIAARLFTILAENNINIDMIVQSATTRDLTDISFIIDRNDVLEAVKIVEKARAEIGGSRVLYDIDCAKISIVGGGIKKTPGIAARMFRALAEQEINIQMISTSDLKISVVINSDRVEDAVKAIAREFNLVAAEAAEEVPAGR